jgi:hypothetical protein
LAAKLFLFFYRAPWLTRGEFAQRYLSEHVPLMLQHCPHITRYVANVVENDIEGFDNASELWVDAIEDFMDPSRLYGSPEGQQAVEKSRDALVGRTVAYSVSERVQRDYERTWPDGERSPGQKLIAPLNRIDGLTHEQFVEHWTTTHSQLALEHVLGMGRYVTNVVERALTPGAPEIDGIVEVHYTGKREFDSPDGQRIMVEDTQSLLQTPVRHMAGEYIFRS